MSKIDNGRKAALDVINDIIKNGAYGNLAIKDRFQSLDERQSRFATRLVNGCIEKLITIDWILSHHLKKTTKLTIKNILRMGVYQIYYMDSVPHRAACSSSVELAKSVGKGGASGFINAVLRNVIRDIDTIEIPDEKDNLSLSLSIKYSCPQWIVDMFIKELTLDTTRALLSYTDNHSSTIRPNSLKNYDKKMLKEYLDKKNIGYTNGKFIEDAFILNSTFNAAQSSLFKEGKIAIQDEGSMLIAKTCIDTKPKNVLDACAAPGGKTSAMAHFNDDINYFATDIHRHRIEIMDKEFQRLGVNAKTYRFDMSKNVFEMEFDTILVDAPCSGLGTMFKQPDIKYSKTFDQIRKLSILQKKILSTASKCVKLDGYLIYSTCTLTKTENHDVVSWFLKEHKDFDPVAPSDELKKYYDGLGITLMPQITKTAGFYISILKRINPSKRY